MRRFLRGFGRVLLFTAVAALLCWPREAPAQNDQRALYRQADLHFRSLSRQQQHELQMLLGVAGYSQSVSLDQFTGRLFDSITRFQTQNGFRPTGILPGDQWELLRKSAASYLNLWRLEPVLHPVTATRLWVPAGLDLKSARTKDGLRFTSARYPIKVELLFFPNIDITNAYKVVAEAVAQKETVIYQIGRPDFFVIASQRQSIKTYVRYQSVAGGIVGFELAYEVDSAFDGDRLATIISDLFRSTVSLSLNIQPPDYTPTARPHDAQPRADVPPEANTPSPKTSTGTGFAVSQNGHFVTNAHVVNSCRSIWVVMNGNTVPARLLARDEQNDLAALQATITVRESAVLKRSVRLGEEIAIFGFPLSGILTSTGNFTRGNITATAGLRDDTRYLQMQAPVQQGNSGGPLLDNAGNIVGVVTSKLNVLKLAAITDDIAQNINFAVKSSILMNFLEANSIKFQDTTRSQTMQPADIAEYARGFTAQIECRN